MHPWVDRGKPDRVMGGAGVRRCHRSGCRRRRASLCREIRSPARAAIPIDPVRRFGCDATRGAGRRSKPHGSGPDRRGNQHGCHRSAFTRGTRGLDAYRRRVGGSVASVCASLGQAGRDRASRLGLRLGPQMALSTQGVRRCPVSRCAGRSRRRQFRGRLSRRAKRRRTRIARRGRSAAAGHPDGVGPRGCRGSHRPLHEACGPVRRFRRE